MMTNNKIREVEKKLEKLFEKFFFEINLKNRKSFCEKKTKTIIVSFLLLVYYGCNLFGF